MPIKMPIYMVDFTPRTIDAILSPAALNGDAIELDVYAKNDVAQKLVATGVRGKDNPDVMTITTNHNGATDVQEWNYTILRESADRNRKKKR